MSIRQIVPSGSRSHRDAFTLVELLVVIAIIGVLVGLLLAVNAARESARRNTCANNLKQIAAAIINYETANRSFPPGRIGYDAYTGSPSSSGLPGSQTPATSAFLAILPQLDDFPTYSLFTPFPNGAVYPAIADATTSGWSSYVSSAGTTTGVVSIAQALLTMRPAVYACPSDSSQPVNSILNPPATTGSYALVLGDLGANPVLDANGNQLQAVADEPHQKYYNNGAFIYGLAHRAADVRDGLSSTMFVGETIDGHLAGSLNSWALSVAYLCSMRSTNNPLNTAAGSGTLVTITHSGLSGIDSSQVTGAFASRHPSGANFAFGDGHVKYIANAIDMQTYQAVSTIAGQETIMGDY